MRLYLQVKQIAKRRAVVAPLAWDIQDTPHNVAELIALVVAREVDAHNERAQQQDIVRYLTTEEVDNQATTGRVAFGLNYNGRLATHASAIENALQAYADGIFRIFVGENEAGVLDSPIELHEGDTLSFVRLTMLAGRLW